MKSYKRGTKLYSITQLYSPERRVVMEYEVKVIDGCDVTLLNLDNGKSYSHNTHELDSDFFYSYNDLINHWIDKYTKELALLGDESIKMVTTNHYALGGKIGYYDYSSFKHFQAVITAVVINKDNIVYYLDYENHRKESMKVNINHHQITNDGNLIMERITHPIIGSYRYKQDELFFIETYYSDHVYISNYYNSISDGKSDKKSDVIKLIINELRTKLR